MSLRDVGDDWRAVADVTPHDHQRRFVFPMAARYLLLSVLAGEWQSLGIYADDEVVGHVMWAREDDGVHWIGGLIVDHTEQGAGLGRAATATLVSWLRARPGATAVRLSYHPNNSAAAQLYAAAGFEPANEMEDGEIVVECR